MKYYFICLSFLLSVAIANFQQSFESLVPLNFVDAINQINRHKVYQNNFFNSSNHVNILNEFKKHSFDSLFKEPLENIFQQTELDYESFKFKLNVSQKCSKQLNEFVGALRQEKIWALKGEDKFYTQMFKLKLIN